MGLNKIYKEIEQKAKHLPVTVRDGYVINHVKMMKRIYREGKMAAVNDYIRQVFYDDKMGQIKQNQ